MSMMDGWMNDATDDITANMEINRHEALANILIPARMLGEL